ncbi:HlyD family secretion protein [Rhodovulum adriaticum]|uniref:HlyD family secretion protein n=1 Tax=Rhodovulum adriaticum TaxID=35804 RepID=A0A4R2NLF2_RHOAD|nr:HlyD family efflux transporter periplasmic adaptor subunit [Rhodovulum adriaticum]MBK1636008.1 secretion protein HlyD [Rhodovulum adriaticum]TCP22439.1 HlyD family secretion protein [Rhodovulum adriaticum]
MRKKTILALVLVVLAAGAGLVTLSGGGSDLPDGLASGNGRIEAAQVDVATKIAGRLSEVFVAEGDLVQPGQELARIDTAQLNAQLMRAQADIASAESQVAAAKAQVEEARARLILAEKELARAESLVDQGHTSAEVYDTRLSATAVARANLAAAEANQISAERAVDAARAAAQEVQSTIDDAVLNAPAVGRVLYQLAEPGEVLGSGGKVLTLVDLSDVYMEIFLPSSQAHRVGIGTEARVVLDILDDIAIPATVSFVSPESQFTPKEVETREERDKLMFRVKLRIPQALVMDYVEQVKTGIRGVGYVRLAGETQPDWPDALQALPPQALN